MTNSDIEPEKQIRVRMKSEVAGRLPSAGAPLLDEAGRFFGFVTGSEKVGLVPSTRLLRVLGVSAARNSLKDVLARDGSIRAGWLGVWLDDTTDRGRIQKVVEGGPAERAGLQDGDLILRLGDSTVWSKSTLVRLLRWESPGNEGSIDDRTEGPAYDHPGRARLLARAVQSQVRLGHPAAEDLGSRCLGSRDADAESSHVSGAGRRSRETRSGRGTSRPRSWRGISASREVRACS